MGEVCPESEIFGVVVVGKGAKSVKKGTENSKLLAHISGYLRVLALICGFGEKSPSGRAPANQVTGRGGNAAVFAPSL